MKPHQSDPQTKARLLIWWMIWGATLEFLVLLYGVLATGKPLPASAPASELPRNLVAIVPLFITIIIRWLVLPRYTDERRALVVFIAGLALAETGGILGLFLGGPYRDSLWVLGVLAVGQYMPFYTRKLFDPKGTGFIPNN